MKALKTRMVSKRSWMFQKADATEHGAIQTNSVEFNLTIQKPQEPKKTDDNVNIKNTGHRTV